MSTNKVAFTSQPETASNSIKLADEITTQPNLVTSKGAANRQIFTTAMIPVHIIENKHNTIKNKTKKSLTTPKVSSPQPKFSSSFKSETSPETAEPNLVNENKIPFFDTTQALPGKPATQTSSTPKTKAKMKPRKIDSKKRIPFLLPKKTAQESKFDKAQDENSGASSTHFCVQILVSLMALTWLAV